MKLSQYEKIILTMYEFKEKKKWYAKDFQHGKYFVGYEATARMSELIWKYPGMFIVGMDGRFRTLEFNWKEKDKIEEVVEIIYAKIGG